MACVAMLLASVFTSGMTEGVGHPQIEG